MVGLKELRRTFHDARHSIVRCRETGAWYHGRTTRRGGYWVYEYTCQTCDHQGRFLRNFLGTHKVYCNGSFVLLGTQESRMLEEALEVAMK